MTLGFGDIVPRTHLGRGVAFLCTMFGLLNESYMVMMVDRRSNLRSIEFEFYSNVIYHRKIRDILMPLAIVSIQRFIRLHQKRVRGLSRLKEFLQMSAQFQNFRLVSGTLNAHRNLSVKELVTLFEDRIPQKLKKISNSLSTIHELEGIGRVAVRNQFAIQRKLESIENMLATKYQYYSENCSDSGQSSPRKSQTFLKVSKAQMTKDNKDARKKMLKWLANRDGYSSSRSKGSGYSEST